MSERYAVLECASSRVALRVVPERGGKVTSLRHLPTGREWLASPHGSAVDHAVGSTFDGSDAYGWDECFPTIASGAYPLAGPHQGTWLPDHGELWSQPWRVLSSTAVSVELEATGLRLPYFFRRRIDVDDADVHVAYAVENTSDEAFAALWAMHPLFAVEADSRIELPGATAARVVASPSADVLAGEHEVAWPLAATRSGKQIDLSTHGTRTAFALKLVVVQPPKRVALAPPPQAGAWLGLELPLAEMPHLGVWVNEGGWPEGSSPLRHVALEPTNGLDDNLGAALALGSGFELAPRETRTWSLTLRLGSDEPARREWLQGA